MICTKIGYNFNPNDESLEHGAFHLNRRYDVDQSPLTLVIVLDDA